MTPRSIAAGSGRAYDYLPSAQELARLRQRGLTRREIADLVERETGIRPTLAAITMRLKRAGLTEPAKRYAELVPWTVRDEHTRRYPVVMLRAEARRRRGEELDADTLARLDSWLGKLQERGHVVTYLPDTDEGFWYVPRQEGDDDIIRRPKGRVRVRAR